MNVKWRKVKSKWCKACKMKPASEVHHIIARCAEGGNEEENLIDLCRECHLKSPNGHENMNNFITWGGSEYFTLYGIIKTLFVTEYPDKNIYKKIFKIIRDERRLCYTNTKKNF